MNISLKIKLDNKELLPKNLEFSTKFRCLAYSTANTKIKIVKFVTKIGKKERKRGSYNLNLREINSDNLFCPIKKISFNEVRQLLLFSNNTKDFLLISDMQRLIYIYDYSTCHSKFFLRGRTITSQLIRSISWFDGKELLVTDFQGNCSFYSPNISFNEDINYHKLIKTGGFQNLNCLDFSKISSGLISDAFGGVSKSVIVQKKIALFFMFVLEKLDKIVSEKRKKIENQEQMMNSDTMIYFSEDVHELITDPLELFMEAWKDFKNMKKNKKLEYCLDVSSLACFLKKKNTLNQLIEKELNYDDQQFLLKVFKTIQELFGSE